MDRREQEARSEGMVTCPECRNKRYNQFCLCNGSGLTYRNVALLHCELFQKTTDTTQAQKDEVYQFALSEYGEDIRNKPRTQLDDVLDEMGFP